MSQASSRKLAAALLVIGVVLLLTTRHSQRPPSPYVAEAVIQLIKPQSENFSIGEALHAEQSILESTALLDNVITNLNLASKWSQTSGEISPPRIRHRLSSSINVSRNDTAEQLRLRVSGSDKQQTEEIANAVLRVYQDLRKVEFKQSKPRNIVSYEEQLEELEPKLRLAIETIERLGKELNVTDLYAPPRAERTLLDRINNDKEAEETENTDSFFSRPPKDETPAQAKRRIYFRSRRVADILSLRKQRIEYRLEIERSRTSTPESPSVQVVQTPEAILQAALAPKSERNRLSFPGWGFVFGGIVLFLRTLKH